MKCLKYNHNVYLKYKKSFLGGYGFNSLFTAKSSKRFQQYSVTNDPKKIWPGGIVSYMIDSSLSKYSIVWLMHDDCSCIITQHTYMHTYH